MELNFGKVTFDEGQTKAINRIIAVTKKEWLLDLKKYKIFSKKQVFILKDIDVENKTILIKHCKMYAH